MKGGKKNDIDLGQHSLFAYSHFFLCLSEEFLPINLSNFYPNLASISQGTWSGTAQFSSVTQSYPTLQHHGLQYARLTSPSPTPIACSKSCPLSWWCHQTISSSVIPFSSCPQSFPASIQFSSVQSLSRVRLFATPWIAARQASLSITTSRSSLRFMSIKSFQMSQLSTSGGQSIGVSGSTSVLPMNTQDWSPLGWTGLISLQAKGLSKVFSNTTVQKHQFFGTQLSLYSNSHSCTWKNHSFDQTDICRQSNVFSF